MHLTMRALRGSYPSLSFFKHADKLRSSVLGEPELLEWRGEAWGSREGSEDDAAGGGESRTL